MEKLYFVHTDIVCGNLYSYGGSLNEEFFSEVEYDIISNFCLDELELIARGLTFVHLGTLPGFLLTGESLQAEILEVKYTIELQKQNNRVLFRSSEEESTTLNLVDFIALTVGWLKIKNETPRILEFSKEENNYVFALDAVEKIVISKESPEYNCAQLIVSKYLEKPIPEKSLKSNVLSLRDMIELQIADQD